MKKSNWRLSAFTAEKNEVAGALYRVFNQFLQRWLHFKKMTAFQGVTFLPSLPNVGSNAVARRKLCHYTRRNRV